MVKRVLVIGDIIIDHYIYVDTKRNAAEAPIPVWDHLSEEWRLGGAANVAHNLKSLGKDDIIVELGGICGKVSNRDMMKRAGIVTSMISTGQVMHKHRYVHEGKVIFRSDSLNKFSSSETKMMSDFFADFSRDMREHYDAIVISDYDKGTITPELMSSIKRFDCTLVVVDSKRFDLSIFDGATLLKLNEKEAEAQVAHPYYTNPERLFDYVVVTRGNKPTELRMGDREQTKGNRYVVHTEEFPIQSVEPIDVTGCGDTHVAAMTFSLLQDQDVRKAVRFANACATSVVRKFGTSTV